jgi:hypothetical protein
VGSEGFVTTEKQKLVKVAMWSLADCVYCRDTKVALDALMQIKNRSTQLLRPATTAEPSDESLPASRLLRGGMAPFKISVATPVAAVLESSIVVEITLLSSVTKAATQV